MGDMTSHLIPLDTPAEAREIDLMAALKASLRDSVGDTPEEAQESIDRDVRRELGMLSEPPEYDRGDEEEE